MEYAAEVWWTEGHSACKKLELAHMKMGRRMFGGKQHSSRSGSEGRSVWWKLEERRKEMKLMCGERLEVLEEG